MKVSILGLGYVGCVSAACLARDGNEVIGVDVNPVKVELLASGKSPIVEPGLNDLIEQFVGDGRLQVSTDVLFAVKNTNVSLICVGTPSNDNGSLNLDYVKNVCREIGEALAKKDNYHVVVVRSTVLPGTVEELLIPILEQNSGKKAGIDFGVCMNPEFLREGSAIKDYYKPGYEIIGELDQKSGDVITDLYKGVSAPTFRVSIRIAEMVKYVSNAFHALKIVFANEVGSLSRAQGIDGQQVMEIFCADTQLNISTTYLRPGYAFGGSCLPKDVRALLYRAKELDVECEVLSSVIPSNQKQIETSVKLVEKAGKKKVGFLGLSFKPDTDDLRESPAVILAETLLGKGYHIKIYDDKVELSRLIGANKAFLESELPHIASLMCSSMEELIKESDVVIITNGSKAFKQAPELMSKQQVLIDLVGVAKESRELPGAYEGIGW
ncbi:MAG: GDP-mannose dehydrogenase [Anaerolineae bacterium]|nr:MAG: GDP-mannose dehydrogenase [Anaerolineae bacterium]WKZ45139.1 MAG: UDP-glucose/GDP-mannose dehydrogenase family protein [Anaerolineales bacterium]